MGRKKGTTTTPSESPSKSKKTFYEQVIENRGYKVYKPKK